MVGWSSSHKEWSNELGTTFDESTFVNYVCTRYGVSTSDELSGDDKVKLFEWLRVAFNDMKANMEQILQNMRFMPAFPKEGEDYNPRTASGGVYAR